MLMTDERLQTGILAVLDTALNGGLVSKRSFVLRDDSGAGKTLTGLRFLEAGAEGGETTLFVHLSETEVELREKAASVGIDAETISFLDLRANAPDADGRQETFAATVDDAALVGRLSERISSLDLEPRTVPGRGRQSGSASQ
jgi:circadian clock protein KaiC